MADLPLTLRLAEGCQRCPALVANRRHIVRGYGLPPGDGALSVVFVGIAILVSASQ